MGDKMTNIHYAGRFKSMDEVPISCSSYIRYDYFKKYCDNKIVVDIGCGGGQGTYLISRIAKFIYGLDFVQENIDWCNRYWFNENIEYKLFDFSKDNLNFNYDVCIMSEVIEHLLINIEDSILKIKRNMNIGGFLCLTFPENEALSDNHFNNNIKREEVCIFLNKNGYNVLKEFDYMNSNKSSLIVAIKVQNDC